MRDWHRYVREHLPPLGCGRERETQVVDELAEQLQDIYDAGVRAGLSHEAADLRAREEVTDWAALARDLLEAEHPVSARPRALAQRVVSRPGPGDTSRAARLLELADHLRHGLRALRAQPLFTLTTVLTFAVGIGVTTLVYALVRTVLLAPLPYAQPERLALVQQVIPEIAERYPVMGVNPRSFLAWQQACRSTCDALAAIGWHTATLTGDGEAEGLAGARITPNLFDVLGVSVARGRAFEEAEATPGRDSVVIITHGLWQRRFGAALDVVGRRMTLDGVPIEIVGVLPASFSFPEIARFDGTPFGTPDYFRPFAWPPRLRQSWGEFGNAVVLRLREGATIDAATAELRRITDAEFAEAPLHPYPVVQPLAAAITGDVRGPLWLLLGAVAVALLIACVNIANLIGARWTARQRELAIRTAIGASRARLAALVATESLVLAVTGSALGVAGAWLLLHTIVSQLPVSLPRIEDARLDRASLLVAAALTAACGLVAGLLPAWWAARVDPGEALKAGSRTTTGPPQAATLRGWLVGLEVALTTLLLVLGGLLVASFVNVLRVDRGFSTESVVAADLVLSGTRYPDEAARARFLDQLLAALDRTPSIASAGLSQKLPLEGDATVDSMIPDGDPRPIAEQPMANHLQVSAGYFETVKLPLIRGRLLTPEDHARRVAVISQRAADVVWPNQDALGRSFTRTTRQAGWEVVGIVGDAHVRGLERDVPLVAYVPYGVETAGGFSIAVRSLSSPALAIADLRDVARRIDPELPLQRPRTLDAVLDGALALRRFQMRLVMAFAGAGLLLACIGIYGVSSGAVERRRNELAVRLALGASAGQVRRLVVRQGLMPVVAGLAIGLALGIAAARTVGTLLFGVEPTQPGVAAAVAVTVLLVAVVACLEPAVRAARTPLASTLRE